MNHKENNVDPYYQLSPHFQAHEFFCHDGTPIAEHHIDPMKHLLEFLERARFGINLLYPQAGEIGIEIVSGFRHPEYNKEKGGAVNSGHLFETVNIDDDYSIEDVGGAADFRFTGPHIPYAILWKTSIAVDKSFPDRPYRLGSYIKSKGKDAWVHVGTDYDIGGTRWFK